MDRNIKPERQAFCFPVTRLENSRLILEPFDLPSHAEPFVQGIKDNPELFNFVSQGPFSTTTEFQDWYKARIESSDREFCYAIMTRSDSSSSGGEQDSFAGMIGLQNASVENATIEIGFITVLPKFRRTFVTSNAVGLLLLYTLDLPPKGLGLRRCQWQSHALNEASKRVATRMGFTFESVQRFQRVVPMIKIGNGYDTSCLPDHTTGKMMGPSRDSAVFAHYCDEWSEKRVQVLAVMNRE